MKLQVMALITREKRTRGLQTCLCHNLDGNGLLQPVHVASSTFAASPMNRALPQVSWLACSSIKGFCPGLISTALRKSLYGAIPADRRGIRLQPIARSLEEQHRKFDVVEMVGARRRGRTVHAGVGQNVVGAGHAQGSFPALQRFFANLIGFIGSISQRCAR
jgi:hypothetical protein